MEKDASKHRNALLQSRVLSSTAVKDPPAVSGKRLAEVEDDQQSSPMIKAHNETRQVPFREREIPRAPPRDASRAKRRPDRSAAGHSPATSVASMSSRGHTASNSSLRPSCSSNRMADEQNSLSTRPATTSASGADTDSKTDSIKARPAVYDEAALNHPPGAQTQPADKTTAAHSVSHVSPGEPERTLPTRHCAKKAPTQQARKISEKIHPLDPSRISKESLIYAQRHILEFDQNICRSDVFFCYPGMFIDDTVGMEVLRACMCMGPNNCETLVVACGHDDSLDEFIVEMKRHLANFPDERSKFSELSIKVAERLGGPGDSALVSMTNRHIQDLRHKRQSAVVNIGQLKYGVCRHRAILFKVCCDSLGLRCRLVHGKYGSGNGHDGLHAWNVVELYSILKVVDVMHTPGEFHDATDSKVAEYHRLVEHAFSRGSGISQPFVPLRPGRIPPNSYEIIRDSNGAPLKLGGGAFGEVFKGKFKGETVAVKELRILNTFNKSAFEREIEILHGLRHEHIIVFKGACLEPAAGQCVLITEFAEGGDLADAITNRSKDMAWQNRGLYVALQIARGLQYLHSLQPPVFHRDLKPQNVVLTRDLSAKITDFGLSVISSDATVEHQGSYTYMYSAPEVLEHQRTSDRVDIYSFGMILKSIVLQKHPSDFGGIAAEDFLAECPQQLQDLIRWCLKPTPQRRPSASEVVTALETLQEKFEPYTPSVITPGSKLSTADSAKCTEYIIDEDADNFLRRELGLNDTEIISMRENFGVRSYKQIGDIDDSDRQGLRDAGLTEFQVRAFMKEKKNRWPSERAVSAPDPNPLTSSSPDSTTSHQSPELATPSQSHQSIPGHSAGSYSGITINPDGPCGDYQGMEQLVLKSRRMCGFANNGVKNLFSADQDWKASNVLALADGYIEVTKDVGYRAAGLPDNIVQSSLSKTRGTTWGVKYAALGPRGRCFFLLRDYETGSLQVSFGGSDNFNSCINEDSWDKIDIVAIGEGDAFYVQRSTGQYTCGKDLPKTLVNLLQQLHQDGKVIQQVSLGANNIWFVKHQAGWQGSSGWPEKVLNKLEDIRREGGYVQNMVFGTSLATYVLVYSLPIRDP